MNTLLKKIKAAKNSRVGLGDVVTFNTSIPFIQGRTPWGTIVEQVDRGVTGQHLLCAIQWFNLPPGKRGNITYHYENELLRLDEKLAYDALKDSVVWVVAYNVHVSVLKSLILLFCVCDVSLCAFGLFCDCGRFVDDCQYCVWGRKILRKKLSSGYYLKMENFLV